MQMYICVKKVFSKEYDNIVQTNNKNVLCLYYDTNHHKHGELLLPINTVKK